jgi:hypothetical protein
MRLLLHGTRRQIYFEEVTMLLVLTFFMTVVSSVTAGYAIGRLLQKCSHQDGYMEGFTDGYNYPRRKENIFS